MKRKGRQRKLTAKKKLQIVLAGLDGSMTITELCRREDINPTQYHIWKRKLLDAARTALSEAKKTSRRR
ncbi:MAG: transposase [Pirellulales bacterium]